MLGINGFTNAEQLYLCLSRSTDDYIYFCNMKTNEFYFPPAMVEEFDLPGSFMEDATVLWAELIHEDERADFYKDFQSMLDGKTDCHHQEYRARNKYGEWVWLRCRGYLQREADGEPSLFAGILTNIGRKGRIDPVCHLPNKFDFENQLSHSTQICGVMVLGLDGFKVINNLYGHDFGDQVLKVVAGQLQEMLPGGFYLYRLDGDHFGILSESCQEGSWKQLYAQISTEFSSQKNLKGQKYYCTFSAGCAMVREEDSTGKDLYKQAEFAMEAAKKKGRNQLCMFEPELMDKRLRQMSITQLLREDVEKGCVNFEVVYQPQIVAQTGKLYGAEALLRWHSDLLGYIAPTEFIPILEVTGMIHRVGKWVLEQAVATCRRWQSYLPDFVMSVNISYLQFLRKDFVSDLEEILRSQKFKPSALTLELTESYLVSDNRMLSESFESLRQMGMKIAMDDFGTGYSSLSVLKNCPADIVKIDRAFVKDILVSRFDVTFIQFVIALCHSVNIQVCLEGVETEEEYRAVKEMGLDMIQGYLFGKPVDRDQFFSLFVKQ